MYSAIQRIFIIRFLLAFNMKYYLKYRTCNVLMLTYVWRHSSQLVSSSRSDNKKNTERGQLQLLGNIPPSWILTLNIGIFVKLHQARTRSSCRIYILSFLNWAWAEELWLYGVIIGNVRTMRYETQVPSLYNYETLKPVPSDQNYIIKWSRFLADYVYVQIREVTR